MKTRTAEDFKTAAARQGIYEWVISHCSICKVELFYEFDHEDTVFFSTSCGCTKNPTLPAPRTWKDIADHYNLQTNETIITKYDEYWGFDQEDN